MNKGRAMMPISTVLSPSDCTLEDSGRPLSTPGLACWSHASFF